VRLLFDGDLDALGNFELDRVRLTERERDGFALEFGAIADADDVELFFEAGGNAGDRVGDESARETVNGAMIVGITQRVEHAIFLLEADAARNADGQLALGALDVDLLGRQGDLHAAGHWNWFFADT
jgi:hypothetical protein